MEKAIIAILTPKEGYSLLKGDLSILVRRIKPNCKLPAKVYAYIKNERKTQLLKGPGLYDREEIAHIAQGGLLKTTDFLNGKVIAAFTLHSIEEVKFKMDWLHGGVYNVESYSNEKSFERDCCMNQKDLDNYLNQGNDKRNKSGYAWRILAPKVFDEPKDLNEFHKLGYLAAVEEEYKNNLHEGYDKSRAWWKAELLVHPDYSLARFHGALCYIEDDID